MSLLAASSRIDYSQLPSLLQAGPSPPRRRAKRRQNNHSWTDEELNLLSYLRHFHHWRFKQIQKLFFPSLSLNAVEIAYRRLPIEDRERRASAASTLITNSRSDPDTQSNFEQGPSHLHPFIARPLSQSGNNIETSTLSLPSSATEDELVVSNNSNTNRYNLRPNRPTTFPQRKPRCLVDRRRFPQFSKSYRYHLNLQGSPDRDYIPPSRSPTPDPSDRSPSVISSPPSVASSLELFGLEAPSLSHSDHDSAATSNNGSSPEFFSSEERLPTP